MEVYNIVPPYQHGGKEIKAHYRIDSVDGVDADVIYYGQRKSVVYLNDGTELSFNVGTIVTEKPKDSIELNELKVLPYYVDLIQDRYVPKQFEDVEDFLDEVKNAQLMVERNGLYQKYKKDNKKYLLAINSYSVTEYH